MIEKAKTSSPKSDTPARVRLIHSRIELDDARRELAKTLDNIEQKLNVPKRINTALHSSKVKLRTVAEEKPLVLVALAIGITTAVSIGFALWKAQRKGR